MRIVRKGDQLERELREVWVCTGGSVPGVVNPEVQRTWPIYKGDEISEKGYELLDKAVIQHYCESKERPDIKWVRLEWTGFDPLPFRAEDNKAS